jgi:2-polyprenyl-3-methyl-5-hydroxy-6-metoxy-1,4-benzoquinol methylase
MPSYFSARRVVFDDYKNFKLPKYLINELPKDKMSKILDIVSGPGHFLKAFKELSYCNVQGIDIDTFAVENSKKDGLTVELITDLNDYLANDKEKYDFIIMNHLIEHLKKDEIIPILKMIYDNKLNKGGKLFIASPNAQSLIGAYWAYEDWTHNTIFTSGSLYFVLYLAGFRDIRFLDVYGLTSLKIYAKFIRYLALKFYEFYLKIRNRITINPYHPPSEMILTWEIKCIAAKL